MTPWPHEDRWKHVDLPPLGALPGHRHLFESRTVWAIKAALGARRPLLVRGEPGTGKSELARAAAQVLKRPLITQVITARTEPGDLHYRYDAVARLGNAQVLAASSGKLEDLAEQNFVQPGPLWWVFDWEGAKVQQRRAAVKGPKPPEAPSEWKPEQGSVLLIDEIDKADADLPNGLLESLGNGAFHVPYWEAPIACAPGEPPLVIITTNEERELPAAFVRRCLVLSLELPKGEALKDHLQRRGRAHFGEGCTDQVYETAAAQLLEDRTRAEEEGLPLPGQAEYLDLLRAVIDLSKDAPDVEATQLEVLREIQSFALNKNAPELA